MQDQGVGPGELNTRLLQKIEELTLYLIEKDRTDQIQKADLEALRKQGEILKQRIHELEQKIKQ
ncbi:hypothetical protein DDR33_19240 [Pararcticibacter amylolyticus]|uniref:Uncharacterized protein n=2 Tax=Pararcticibacter amylolyticus TaxID=2173175 RepID=A0A2U2PC55_9SPHI|nr:hypothetical protein DDR33_19240 [Pararcticibacter amylolyticus]